MVFMAKAKHLRVVLKPAFHVLDSNGQRVQIQGKTAEFNGGRYETQDPNEIALLLEHPYYKVKYVSVDNEREWIEKHPEYMHKPVQMITGTMTTINSSPLIDRAREPFVPEKKEEQKTVDLDTIIEEKLNKKFGALSEKLDKILALAEEDDAPKKRSFTCPVPGCGYVGKSGMEIGKHKKEAHAE